MGKIFGAGKRVLTGESLFMTAFTNRAAGKKRVAFAPCHPGRIIPMDLAELGGELICQKDAFLCAAKGVSIGIAFQKKLGVGFFGGEGFILQRLRGDGDAFVHAAGTLVERDLAPGEQLKVDTGCLVALQPTVRYDIEYVGNDFPNGRIIFRHLLPNAMAPVLVSATFGVAGAILIESALSFLGFGVAPPTASWGELLSQSKRYIEGAWWLVVYPGAMIFITVTAFNLVGEGLRDAMGARSTCAIGPARRRAAGTPGPATSSGTCTTSPCSCAPWPTCPCSRNSSP